MKTKSKNSIVVNDFLNSLKGKIVGAVVALIVFSLVSKWDNVVKTFDEGVEAQEVSAFNSRLDTALSFRFKDPIFMTKYVINSPFFIDWRRNERDLIITNMKQRDSSQINMSAYLSSITGMNKISMMDTIGVMIKLHNKGRAINNNQCIRNSKEYGRGQHFIMKQ